MISVIVLGKFQACWQAQSHKKRNDLPVREVVRKGWGSLLILQPEGLGERGAGRKAAVPAVGPGEGRPAAGAAA